jgi:hypothetical protein
MTEAALLLTEYQGKRAVHVRGIKVYRDTRIRGDPLVAESLFLMYDAEKLIVGLDHDVNEKANVCFIWPAAHISALEVSDSQAYKSIH